jgi:aldehyde:ferredoxin oxidoreductase
MQIRACFYDTVGLCHFADGTPESAEWLAKLLSPFYGERLSADYVMETGQKVLQTELDFNLAAGFTEADDRLPEFMLRDPLPPTNATFSVAREEIQEAFAGLKKERKP